MTDRQDRAGKQHQLARDIIDHLPGVWTYSDEESRDYYAVLREQGGSGLRLRMDDKRLRITGMWPSPLPGHRHNHMFDPSRHGFDDPAIMCNPDRGAEAIAKDIACRFLPKYTPLWLAMLDKRAERLAEQELEAAVIQRLLAAGAGSTERNRVYFRYNGDSPHGHADVSVNGDEVRVSIDIGGIPLETAEVIIAELADCRTRSGLPRWRPPTSPRPSRKRTNPSPG